MNEVELETEYPNVDKDAWTKMIESSKQTIESIPHAYYDVSGVDYLSPIIDGYMLAPVGIHNGATIAAQTVKFDDISKVLAEFMEKGERIVMYMLMYIPAFPVYTKLDETTLANIPLEVPEMIGGFWRMRYAIAHKTKNVGVE